MGIKEYKPSIRDLAPVFSTVAGAAIGGVAGYAINTDPVLMKDYILMGIAGGGAVTIAAYTALGFAHSYIMMPECLSNLTNEN